MLRNIRIAGAVAIFLMIVLYFLDFAKFIPEKVNVLTRIQFIPALLAGSLTAVVGIVLATFLFGRIYCSVICPLGIFQDVLGRIAGLFKRRKFAFATGKTLWRGFFLALAVGLGLFVGAGALGLLDPYAIFGRLAATFLAPSWRFGNNLLADHFSPNGIGLLYRVEVFFPNLATLLLAAGTTLLVGFLAVRFGRLYCNAICPVGTFLGFLSRFSLFKIRVDREKCVSCGLCAGRCKAQCLDAKAKRIDASRCVVCFNCLGNCPKDAIHWRLPRKEKNFSESSAVTTEKPNKSETPVLERVNSSKRLFLTTLATTSAAAATLLSKKIASAADVPPLSYNGNVPYQRKAPITPPGSKSLRHFQRHCVACHLCVNRCPSKVLRPSFLEYGPDGFLQPTMSFERGFCNFDCHDCGDVCPTGAIGPLTLDEKHSEQVGRVAFIRENCVVVNDGTSCGACSEHCPTQAVHMVPFKGALTIPEVNPDLCVGCGACESICPVRPYRAIHVDGLPVHQTAEKPPVPEKKEVKIDDFGF